MVVDIEALKVLGKEWVKGDHHRIYFNNICDLLGMEITWHPKKTGVIDHAELGDEYISRSRAETIRNAKVWYDIVEDDFYCTGDLADSYFDKITNEIERRAASPSVQAKVEAIKQEAAEAAADLAQLSEDEIAALQNYANGAASLVRTMIDVRAGLSVCESQLEKATDARQRVMARMLRAALNEAAKNTPEALFKRIVSDLQH